MKAIVYDRYGGPEVLRYSDVPQPSPGGDQVLVRVRAVSVNAPDWRVLRATPWMARLHSGLLRPKFRILGCDIAGVVEAVGPGAKSLRPGDAVFGDLAQFGFGGFAELVCPRERALVRKPDGVPFDLAAATPMAGTAALQSLRDHGRVQPGQRVLIAGASGGVGTFAVQVAKLLGAHVTAVCSASKAELARELGADQVIDYEREDFTASGDRYDVILAINGYRPIRDYRRALAPRGLYLMVGGQWPQIREAILLGPLLSLRGSQKFRVSPTHAKQRDLTYLGELLAAGKLRPVIDRHYPLSEVADAIRYVETGHARGKVIIDVAGD